MLVFHDAQLSVLHQMHNLVAAVGVICVLEYGEFIKVGVIVINI